MTEDTPLSEILNDEPATEVSQEAEVESPSNDKTVEAHQERQERLRDERGRFAAKGDDEAPPASQQDDEGPHVPRRALQDERSKRQALEAELAQYRAQFAQQPAPQQAAPEQAPPDRWEDPEGYDQWLIAQAAQAARAEASQTFQTQRIQASAMEAMQRIPDYREKIEVFEQMASANPRLLDEMVRSPNPAEYAYNMGRTQVEIAQHGGIDGLINARVQEALKAQTPDYANVVGKLPSAPPTISNDRSTGSRSGPAWGGPTPLGDLLR